MRGEERKGRRQVRYGHVHPSQVGSWEQRERGGEGGGEAGRGGSDILGSGCLYVSE